MTRSEIIADIGKTKAEIQRLQEHLADIEKAVEQEETTRFEPKKDDVFYCIDRDGYVLSAIHDGFLTDEGAITFNNVFRPCFENKGRLEKYAHDVLRVQNRLMQLHEELCQNYWGEESGYHEINLYCGTTTSDFWDYVHRMSYAVGVVPFTKEAAKRACEILNAERFMMDEE